jgi:hypothetical protein
MMVVVCHAWQLLDGCGCTYVCVQLLELDIAGEQAPKYSALDTWAQHLQSLHSVVVGKLAV